MLTFLRKLLPKEGRDEDAEARRLSAQADERVERLRKVASAAQWVKHNPSFDTVERDMRDQRDALAELKEGDL